MYSLIMAVPLYVYINIFLLTALKDNETTKVPQQS